MTTINFKVTLEYGIEFLKVPTDIEKVIDELSTFQRGDLSTIGEDYEAILILKNKTVEIEPWQ